VTVEHQHCASGDSLSHEGQAQTRRHYGRLSVCHCLLTTVSACILVDV